ncbi:MAG: acyclic terpene utilization AtuA family protein [Rubrivivax sp.]
MRRGDIHYLVFDYLAELTMSLLAAARLKDPQAGCATDFVGVTMKSLLKDIVERGIKRFVSNAGGMNPRTCAEAVAAIAAEQGVDGEDRLRRRRRCDAVARGTARVGVDGLDGTRRLPDKLVSANAYLGALPIRQALAKARRSSSPAAASTAR